MKQVTLKPRKFGYRSVSLVMGDIDAIIGGAKRTEPRHQLAGDRCDLAGTGSCPGRLVGRSRHLRQLVIASCSCRVRRRRQTIGDRSLAPIFESDPTRQGPNVLRAKGLTENRLKSRIVPNPPRQTSRPSA